MPQDNKTIFLKDGRKMNGKNLECYLKRQSLTYDVMYDLYITQRLSLMAIAKMYGYKTNLAIGKRLKELSISKDLRPKLLVQKKEEEKPHVITQSGRLLTGKKLELYLRKQSLTYDILYDLYIVKNHTAQSIAKMYGYQSSNPIRERLIELSIPLHKETRRKEEKKPYIIKDSVKEIAGKQKPYIIDNFGKKLTGKQMEFYLKRQLMTYDDLYDLYIVKNNTLKVIATMYGYKSPDAVQRRLVELSIPLHKHIITESGKKITGEKMEQYIKRQSLTYDILYDLYIIKGISALEIAKMNQYSSATSIIKRLKELNIPIRNISEANTKFVIDKRTKTNIQKYGFAHNFSKEHPSRIQWEARLLEEEGITNVFQREDIKKKIKISIRNNPDNQQTYLTKSKIHYKTMEILSDWGIEFEDEKIIGDGSWYYYYDISLINRKIVIEVNGDFWHANPLKFNADDIVKLPGKHLTAKEIWDRDLEKRRLAESKGYQVFYLWESEFNDIETLKNKLWAIVEEDYHLTK